MRGGGTKKYDRGKQNGGSNDSSILVEIWNEKSRGVGAREGAPFVNNGNGHIRN